jgi:sugar O-acyltransferase (sialic acid O-acetyltransferase NeuD family)
MSKVVIFGSSVWAQYLHYCLTHDSVHEVVGFTVDPEFIKERTLLGLPIVSFAEVESVFPPSEFKMLVGLSFQKMNRLREEKYTQAKTKGYELISYVSSKAQVWPDLDVGENCLVFENDVIHPFVKIGNNVTICSSVVVGHHTIIKDHAFISPGAVILGVVTIGPFCLIGANATIMQGVTLERECLISMGVSITKDTKAGSVYINPAAELLPQSSEEMIPFLSWSAR